LLWAKTVLAILNQPFQFIKVLPKVVQSITSLPIEHFTLIGDDRWVHHSQRTNAQHPRYLDDVATVNRQATRPDQAAVTSLRYLTRHWLGACMNITPERLLDLAAASAQPLVSFV
jgi:hypothetical protein